MYLVPQRQPSVLSPTFLEVGDDYAPGSRAGSWSIGDSRCDRQYTSRLKVSAASKYAGPAQIVSSLGIHLGDSYRSPLFSGTVTETDTGSFLQSIRAEQATEHATDGSLQWTVTLEYAPYDVAHQLGTSDISSGIICPTDHVIELFFEQAKYARSKPYDESGETADGLPGEPYVNTVGDPLLSPPETEETRPVLTIVRNEAQYNDAYASQFKDAVNSDEFLGFPPNTVKCADIKAERFYDPDWGYWYRVSYRFEFRDDDDGNGYSQMILNAGYRQKVNGTGTPVNITINGQNITDAVPLQKDGSYQPTADPYFLEFAEFPSVAFAGMNIPDDLLTVDS